jgi:hypothetical protein
MNNKPLILALICLTGPVAASDSFFDSISGGDASLSFRYRYENVDQDGFSKDANASTLRTRLNFKTLDYKGFNFFVEADNLSQLFADNYNAGAGNSPGNTRYPVIADPDGTEINQAWFNYNFSEGNGVKVGRQRILLDNQRFVGGVGWRQNEQTYDAISGSFTIGNSKLFTAYINNVNRIFGEDVAAGDHDNNTMLVNWSNKFEDIGKLTLYYYDINNKDAAAFSTSTFGAKFAGKNNNFNYGLEFASQSDAHNNSVNFSANYMRLDGGYQFEKANLFAGYEVLEGDADNAGSSFRTPLATLHAFNGWADKFLGTPNDGIEDFFVGVKGAVNGYKWQAIYHDFGAEDGSRDLGSELDLSVAKKVNKNVSLLLKAALYDADTHATDTNKVWFMVSAGF